MVQSIGLNHGAPKLVDDSPKRVRPSTERDRLDDRSIKDGMAVDVQKIAEAETDTRPSGRIPLK